MTEQPRLQILTNVLAPYQRDLFVELRERLPGPLTVHLMADNERRRSWEGSATGLGPAAVLHRGVSIAGIAHLNPGIPRAIWRSDPADVWVLSGSYVAPSVLLARLALALRPRTWVFWGERPTPSRLRAKRRYLRWFLHRCAEVWSMSSNGAAWYRTATAQPVQVVPYATRTVGVPRKEARPAGAACRLLFAGQLIERKRPRWLLDAAQMLHREGIDVEVAFLGVGPLEGELRGLAAVVPFAVTFHGQVDRGDTMAAMAAADVVALPSTYEGWGMVVPEALSCGTPVVATPGVDSATDLAGSSPAVIVAGDSVAGLAAGLRAALQPEVQDAARERSSLAQVSVEAVAAHVAELVRSLADCGG